MNDKAIVESSVERNAALLTGLSDKVWALAELPYAETQSAAVLAEALERAGFTVQMGVADIPTSFVASFQNGEGGAVCGFLGEFDALDTLSQEAGNPVKCPIKEGAPGHGCGHNALGTGALGAALAYRDYLAETVTPGKVLYFGCAAEEGAGAKQFMARAGCFDGVDFVYTWHPGTVNGVENASSSAILGANFNFKGLTAHAGATPHLGRSALDAAELMSVGCNYLREHMLPEARLHYAYSDAGGVAPNVVQDRATVKYEVRSPKVREAKELFERVVNVARGAALMTDTQMSYEITMAFSDYIPNAELAVIADRALRDIGAPQWDEGDYALAKAYLETYNDETKAAIRQRMADLYGDEGVEAAWDRPLDSAVHPYDPERRRYQAGSTDVGDVTYAVPTLNFSVATACIGNVGHTWQMTGQAGSALAHKGLLVAAKAMALAAVRTAQDPEAVARAKALVLKQNGGAYSCPLPDSVKPPIGKY